MLTETVDNSAAIAPPALGAKGFGSMSEVFSRHWQEYLMEAGEMAAFILVACLAAALFFFPESPVVERVPNESARGLMMGLAMGLTAAGLVYSPWGKQSGAHMNPSVSLTFFRLGKISPWDLCFYITFQLLGVALGALIGTRLITPHLVHPIAEYVVTVPSMGHWTFALGFEGAIGFVTMLVVLYFSNHKEWEPLTGWMAGGVIFFYYVLASPFHVVSLDAVHPEESVIGTLGSAALVYFTTPPLGMLAAAEVFHLFRGHAACAKLNHSNDKRCIFCEFQQSKTR